MVEAQLAKVYKIHRLHLYRGERPPPPTSVQHMTLNNLMAWLHSWSSPSLTLLQGPLLPGIVVPYKVPSIGHVEYFNH